MLLASAIRHGSPIVSDALPWQGLSSHLSSLQKTKEHNDFLSLLAPNRTTAKPKGSMAALKSDAHFSSHGARFDLRDRSQFGSKPSHSSLHIDPSDLEPNISGADRINEAKAGLAGSPQIKPQDDTDIDVDSLVDSMNKHAVIKDLAVTEAKNIELPNGYIMDSEIQPASIHTMRKDIRNDLKRKRQDGVRIQKEELRDAGGFRPQDVNKSGAVSLAGCKPCTLDSLIHPLLGRDRFDDTPDSIYDQLIPALKLATMFLTQPICMQFWVTVALGKRSDDVNMIRKYGKQCQRISEHVKLTQQNTAEIIKHLQEIGEANIIHFAFKQKLRNETGAAWATSAPICDYLSTKRGLKGTLTRSIIRLHADHYVIAKKLSQLKYPEISQQLRFSFFFANLIMHELAHSIEGAYIRMRHEQWAEFQRSRTYMEPFWLDWQRPPECGKAWEHTMFGTEIQPINNRVDGSHGIGMSDWPPKGTDDHPERRTWWTIPMDYIERLFQKSTWERKFDLGDTTAFHIPKTGARSLYINYFTTMSHSALQKEDNEEVAEVMEIVTEQPPPKIRVTGTGEKEEHRPQAEEVVSQAVSQAKAIDSKKPKISNTRMRSEIMKGALPTSREAAPIDRIKGITVQELVRIKDNMKLRKVHKMGKAG